MQTGGHSKGKQGNHYRRRHVKYIWIYVTFRNRHIHNLVEEHVYRDVFGRLIHF